ncbi:MAG: hypothetical protein H7Y42_04620 [Chitinophagaceae bacterium]|nr:hypothetical protein [Chitinophagaceae bacterium]
MDLLSHHTAEYTRMLTEGSETGQFDACKKIITELQEEIEFRKSTENGANELGNKESVIKDLDEPGTLTF